MMNNNCAQHMARLVKWLERYLFLTGAYFLLSSLQLLVDTKEIKFSGRTSFDCP